MNCEKLEESISSTLKKKFKVDQIVSTTFFESFFENPPLENPRSAPGSALDVIQTQCLLQAYLFFRL